MIKAFLVALTAAGAALGAQDQDDDLLNEGDEVFDEVEQDYPDGETVFPDGVVRIRTSDGAYLPPFESRQGCSGGACEPIVVNAETGVVFYFSGAWQQGAIETGNGDEVVVFDQPQ